MGIKDLNKLFKDFFPIVMENKKISELVGKRIAIDGTLFLHKILAKEITAIIKSLNDPVNDEIDQALIIEAITRAFLWKEKFFMEKGFNTFWVFDSTAPSEKKKTQESRIAQKQNDKRNFELKKKTYEEMDELEFSLRENLGSELIKRRSNLEYVHKASKVEIINNLKNLGIAVSIARLGEGELHAASFCFSGLADYVYTTDTDTLAIGANMIVEIKDDIFKVIENKKLLEEFELTQDQFRDLCILLGCDFNKKLNRVNPFETFKLIREHKAIENIQKAVEQEDLNYVECRRLLTPYSIEEDEFPHQCDERLDKIKEFLFKKKQ